MAVILLCSQVCTYTYTKIPKVTQLCDALQHQVMASLPEAWVKNGTARMAAITSTIAVVMSIEDAVAAGGVLWDCSGLATDPFWLLCLACSCNRE